MTLESRVENNRYEVRAFLKLVHLLGMNLHVALLSFMGQSQQKLSAFLVC